MLHRLVLASLLALLAAVPAVAAEKYAIDPRHAQVHFSYDHGGYSTMRGRFDQIESEFLFDAADPTQSSVSVTIAIASVSTGVEKLDAHLLSADFFDAAQFPTATFKSSKVEAAGEGKLRVSGDLTLHGVTKPVLLDVTINKIGDKGGNPAAGFDATTTLKRSDFGVDRFAPMVSDEVQLHISLESSRPKAE